MPVMAEALECIQYLPKGRKTWFCVRTNWHKTPQFLQIERGGPASTSLRVSTYVLLKYEKKRPRHETNDLNSRQNTGIGICHASSMATTIRGKLFFTSQFKSKASENSKNHIKLASYSSNSILFTMN